MTRDLRKYATQTNIRLAIGAVFFLLIVGVGLIWLIYGKGAASFGLFCLLAGLAPVVIIISIFYAIDWILRHAGRK